MAIQIFDTLAGRKREFVPLEPGRVGFYFCGPTVYDYAHLGHARCNVAWDVVVRHLRARGYEVKYVRNFTDVDDKIIRRAAERGEDPLSLARGFADAYTADMIALGNIRPQVEPRVTDHLPEIVELIEKLVSKGFAYPVDSGDVYYAVRKFPGYGRLAKRNLDDLMAGARVDPGEAKRDPLDFALWKGSKPGEPAWDSPWGKGRPGWHIECSAMTLRHLGAPFDIHAGGKDLVFPHHTNEIAQSVAAVSDGLEIESFARYWMHNGFVEIDNEKMSKSLGNFFTVRDLLGRYDGEAIRLFLLGTHYRNPINFSEPLILEAEKRLAYLYETLEKVNRISQSVTAAEGSDENLLERCRAALDDDFNTAAVLGIVADAFTAANALADRTGRRASTEKARLACFARDARLVGHELGLLQRSPAQALLELRDRAAGRNGIDQGLVARRIAERAEARRARDFARSDAIRDELLALGVAIMDGPMGTTWRVA
ncbi:MAG TPA: cysteine--tRNA ligase [Anaeromyxobacteraceae bacterium]|nr:cysteine--tRNA ligase [Anaeromyxobacteraceae bacterium]